MSDQTPNTPPAAAEPAAIVTMMTTEHFTLQTARGATVSEASGRSSLFLGAVSSGLVALSFFGQASKLDESFYVFGLVLFAGLFFLGFVTFIRLLETSLEDAVYARAIARIRHYYLEIAPQMRPYFVLPSNDDMRTAMMGPMGLSLPHIQILLTSAGMVSAINALLAGVFVAFALAIIQAVAGVMLIGGLIVFAVVLAAQTRYQQRQWALASTKQASMFPAQPDTNSITKR